MPSTQSALRRILFSIAVSFGTLLGCLAPVRSAPAPQASAVTPAPPAVTASPTVAVAAASTSIPSNVRIATTDRTLQFATGDKIISTAILCPGFVFDQFGLSGPVFSPDFHWVLVDILGPFQPGNVGRNHALVEVATGGIVRSSDFPQYLGFPSTLDVLSWASGERQTLHYANGPNHVVTEPALRPIPASPCRT